MAQVLFVGGCHILGRPLGAEHAFPELTAQLLRRRLPDVECSAVSHIDLERTRRALRRVRAERPEIVVLQPGGRICPPRIGPRLQQHRLLRWLPVRGRFRAYEPFEPAEPHETGQQAKPLVAVTPEWFPPVSSKDPRTCFDPPLRWRAQSVGKAALELGLSGLGLLRCPPADKSIPCGSREANNRVTIR